MNIHEYQAKALLHEFGVPISRGAAVLRASDSDAVLVHHSPGERYLRTQPHREQQCEGGDTHRLGTRGH